MSQNYLKKELYSLIKTNDEIFDFIQQASLDGIWFLDLENPEQEWMSPEFWKTFGYVPSEKKHLTAEWESIIDPDDLALALENLEKHIKNPDHPYDQVVKYTHKDGSPVWVRCRGRVLHDSAGKPIRVVGAHNDVTELVKQRETFRLNEKRLSRAQKVAQIGCWEMTLTEPNEVFWSEEVFRIVEKDPEDFTPTPEAFLKLVHPDDRGRVPGLLEKSAKNFETFDIEFRLLFDDGSVKWVKEIGEFDYDENQNPLMIHATIQDITEFKRIEQDLLDARSEAQLASDAKTDFLVNISHELRTPLNGVLGLTELALEESNIDSIKQKLRKITAAGKIILEIINNVIDLTRVESRKIKLQSRPLAFETIIDGLRAVFGNQANTKGLDFDVTLNIDESQSLELIGDELHLTQVLSNLLSNAIKYTDNGSVVLKIDLVEITKRAAKIEFAVKDTGIGIESQYFDKVFSPFFQVFSEGSIWQLGSGLGLTISEELVKLMGGKGIEVSSTPGEGSSFSFVLTFDVQAKQASSSIKSPFSELKQNTCFSSKSILITDDNNLNREVMQEMLEKLGYQVISAENGHKALEELDGDNVDLILMDIRMPVMNGYETAQKIRAKLGPNVPIIALSAAAFSEDQQKAYQAGMNDFLLKPISIENLKHKLDKWLCC